MYMYVCMYVYTYIYIYIYTHTFTYVYISNISLSLSIHSGRPWRHLAGRAKFCRSANMSLCTKQILVNSWLKLTQRRPVLDERAGMHH